MKWMMSIIIVFLLLLVGKSGMQVNDASTEVAVTSSVSTEKNMFPIQSGCLSRSMPVWIRLRY